MTKSGVLNVHDRISAFYQDLIELGGHACVNPDHRIAWLDAPDQKIEFSDQPTKKGAILKTLYNYNTDSADPLATLLNPINETGSLNQVSLWFYATTRSIYLRTLLQTINFLLSTAVTVHNSKNGVTNPKLVRVLQSFVNDVDDKMLTEMETLTASAVSASARAGKDPLTDFATIHHDCKTKTTSLFTCFQDKDNTYIKSFGTKIRKKFWGVIAKILQEIFAKEDLLQPLIVATAAVGDPVCPFFRTFISVLLQAWNKLVPYFEFLYSSDGADEMIQRIIRSENNLESVPEFAPKVAWLSSSSGSKSIPKLKIVATGAQLDEPRTESDREISPREDRQPRRRSVLDVCDDRWGGNDRSDRSFRDRYYRRDRDSRRDRRPSGGSNLDMDDAVAAMLDRRRYGDNPFDRDTRFDSRYRDYRDDRDYRRRY